AARRGSPAGRGTSGLPAASLLPVPERDRWLRANAAPRLRPASRWPVPRGRSSRRGRSSAPDLFRRGFGGRGRFLAALRRGSRGFERLGRQTPLLEHLGRLVERAFFGDGHPALARIGLVGTAGG